ncbi:discoidin domain-containing protein [Antarcticibacterium sp. 1MA-6-2]|uniref:discoidin domain-containing protein n=1 Tax=Antarcticibacterium sp. 1MA-6-2 TaxID=2908210 RepID=UPI001F4085B3|nr:discoidin domain-containing protein [Antarcticibacterium sp. 1MA-6-2]UJH90668.1 discoidin domain-containing protein [Antarcticibacterium sp. 1MA-6-2]
MKRITSQILLVGLFLFLQSCEEDNSSFIDGLPDSIVNTDPEGSPPRGFTENYNGHDEILNRQILSGSVGVYYDPEVDRSIEWPLEFFPNAWSYITNTYGKIGSVNSLYVVGHGEEKPSFFSTYFDEETGNRNIIDFPILNSEMTPETTDEAIMLLADLVENANNNVKTAPGSEVWGDAFTEIFTYDLYVGLGMEADAERVKAEYMETTFNGVNWFRDFFLPLYETYDGATTFRRFFNLLSSNYPIDGDQYARNLTLGEIVHFFSGSTGDDLEDLAQAAFNFGDVNQQELLQARGEFPSLNYPFEPASELIDVTSVGNARIEVSSENGSGPEGGEGSTKLIDNNLSTKFLTSGFPKEFYMQQVFETPQVVNRYTFTSGNDAPDRDYKTWVLLGSNDGGNFEELDSRTDITFSERNQTKEFIFENEQAFRYYRIRLDANNGGGLIQLSEWRLINLKLLTFGPQDVTGLGILTVNQENRSGADSNEGSTKLVDNDLTTKFLTFDVTFPLDLTLNFSPGVRVTKYSLTSANDASERDPKSWTLYGSNDNENFTQIDQRTDIVFDERGQTKEFLVGDNMDTYTYYKLEINANGGASLFQVAEWRLFAE